MVIATGAIIRNIGIIDNAIYGSTSDTDIVGGLVGLSNRGTITASYATGTVDGGDGNTDSCRRLGGSQQHRHHHRQLRHRRLPMGVIGNQDRVGGLVGYNSVGIITASYATGTADGGRWQ